MKVLVDTFNQEKALEGSSQTFVKALVATIEPVSSLQLQDTLIHFTTLLYLAQPEDGGRLCFGDGARLEPRPGRVLAFTAGRENTHWVEEVTRGSRVALSLFWTCDPDYRIQDLDTNK